LIGNTRFRIARVGLTSALLAGARYLEVGRRTRQNCLIAWCYRLANPYTLVRQDSTLYLC
jgi:hypothetical protein